MSSHTHSLTYEFTHTITYEFTHTITGTMCGLKTSLNV